MLVHHLQKQILHSLVRSKTARFAELRPKNIDSNLATYHLQQLIKQNLVRKRHDGSYELTSNGKIVGTTVTLTKKDQLLQAHSVVLLAIRDKNGAWLLRERLVQPMYGWSGFIHGEPVATDSSIPTSAKRILHEKTGLTAKFQPIGSGYIRLYNNAALLSYIHFTILGTKITHTDALQDTQSGRNFWYGGNFRGNNMLPSMPDLVALITTESKHFFFDSTYKINEV